MARDTEHTSAEGGGRRRIRTAALGLLVVGATALLRKQEERTRAVRRTPTPDVASVETPVLETPVPDVEPVETPALPTPPLDDEQVAIVDRLLEPRRPVIPEQRRPPEIPRTPEPQLEPVAADQVEVVRPESETADVAGLLLRDPQSLRAEEQPLHLEDLFDHADEPADAVREEQPRRSRRKGKRRNAREKRALAAASDEIAALESAADVAAVDLDGVPADQHAEVLDPPDEPEDTLPADRMAFVPAPHAPRRRKAKRHSRARRLVKVALVVVLIGGAAATPWVVPGIPDLLARSVPQDVVGSSRIDDPKVEPPHGFVGPVPVGVKQASGPYAGVQLASAGRPLHIDVPRLHVSSDVVAISEQSGALTPPDDPQVLGWWQEGRAAGARFGSAVVTGHTVHTGGGAFDHLADLVPGDTIRVRTAAGWIDYVVRRSRIYSVAGLARSSEDIFRQGGDGRLVLITCDDWDGHEYLSNAVVYAVPTKDQPFTGAPAAPVSQATAVPDGGPGAGG